MPIINQSHDESLELQQLASGQVAPEAIVSYCTIQDAQYYFERVVFTDDWDEADEPTRLVALNEATDLVRALDIPNFETYAEVPEDIQIATAEIALKLLEGHDMEVEQREAMLDLQAQGGLKVVNAGKGIPLHIVAGIPSIPAWEILSGYLDINNTVILDRK